MIKKKLFRLLWPMLAYFLFAFQWIVSYKFVWYASLPDETEYFSKHSRHSSMFDNYNLFGKLQFFSFLLFVLFGIIYFVKQPVKPVVSYALIVILVFSSYCAWHFSATLKVWNNMTLLMFVNLALFAYSIFQISKPVIEDIK